MSTAAAAPEPGADAAAEREQGGRFAVLQRVAQGELGSLRVLIGLIVIWAIFTIANDRFLTSTNLVNLSLQIAATGMISIGVVLVLLLGEIDLSVGDRLRPVRGDHGGAGRAARLAGGPGIAAAIAAGAAIGLFQGSVVTRFGIPSFVVTLAGLIGWQGALLWVLGDTGTVNITNPAIVDLAGTFFTGATAWIIAAVVVAAFAVASLDARRRRLRGRARGGDAARRRGAGRRGRARRVRRRRRARPGPRPAARARDPRRLRRGVRLHRAAHALRPPRAGGRRQRGGGAPRRHPRQPRADRWCSCSPARWRPAAGSCSPRACSRSTSPPAAATCCCSRSPGPVIAGTSLFGGRGTVWAALLGGLVIGSISNGMDLLALPSSTKYMVTGGVLLAAVVVDAAARQRRHARRAGVARSAHAARGLDRARQLGGDRVERGGVALGAAQQDGALDRGERERGERAGAGGAGCRRGAGARRAAPASRRTALRDGFAQRAAARSVSTVIATSGQPARKSLRSSTSRHGARNARSTPAASRSAARAPRRAARRSPPPPTRRPPARAAPCRRGSGGRSSRAARPSARSRR